MLGPFLDAWHGQAVHEAAHAVLGFFSESHATRVSIRVPPGALPGAEGFTLFNKSGDVSKVASVPSRGRLSSDKRLALEILRMGDPYAGWKRWRAQFRMARRRAEVLVELHAFLIRFFAGRLLSAGEMGGAEIRATIEAAIRTQTWERLRKLGVIVPEIECETKT